MMKGGLGNLMRQAQQMQETMQKAQAGANALQSSGAITSSNLDALGQAGPAGRQGIPGG